jgi:hypothetical protein
MTDPTQPRKSNVDLVGDPRITPEHARRAARLVVSRFPDDPLAARHILEVLGLLDLPRRRWEPTPAAAPPATNSTETPHPLIDTEAAAEALRTTATSLHRFAQAGIATPARTDPGGRRWWDLPEVRAQLAAYLDDRTGHGPTFG